MILRTSWVTPSRLVTAALLLLLGLAPVYAAAFSEPFYLTLCGRIVVFALAALSLNLILGYGGLVSFGHALYLGIGAYAIGLMSFHGVTNGWAQLALALGASALVGLVTGLVSLRTTGIAFIMITLAFAQMFYFLVVSLKPYGGDDGLPIEARSDFGTLLNLADNLQRYYLAYALLLACLYGSYRVVRSRFGMVLRGSRLNARRMRALGYPTVRYQLTAYVLSAMICALAGLLLANQTQFASPAYMAWTVSGQLIVMVVLGGIGSVAGPVMGAVALLVMEEFLKGYTEHWMAILGPVIVVIALLARRGLAGLLQAWDQRMGANGGIQ
ncbi:branched-chain amino acid ABC transporter permease [Cupriavidus sp. H39]|uniref:branched-chain amino acid ABC transporter permease n=1 Tax=Cupriavidus sp. H39 TaxID=3401635 RepID=UPI003D0075B3